MKYFATPRLFVLDNGMEVYVAERPEQPSAELTACVRTGSIHEGVRTGSGLSHFVEHMLFQGCKGYPGTAAGDFLGKLGGDVNAYTSFDRTVYYVELPSEHVLKGLEVMASMLRFPEFPPDRFASEREIILHEAAMGFDKPSRRLGEQLRQILFRRHPLRHPIIGYPELVAQVTAEDARRYHRERYTPGRIFWVLAGAVDGEDAARTLNRALGNWERGCLDETVLPSEPLPFAPRRSELVMPDPMARLMLGMRLPGVSGAGTVPYEIAAGLLGAGDAAHLVRVLQFEKELAADLESSFLETSGESLVCVTAVTEPGKIRKLESSMLRELAHLRKTGPALQEVRREKLQHKMESLQELRGNSGIASAVAGTVFAGESPEAFDRCMAQADAVTAEEVLEALKKLLNPDAFCLAVQLPEKKSCPSSSSSRQTPRPERTGPRSLCLVNRDLPLCDLVILLPGGDLFTPPETAGVNALTAELLTAGSGRWSEKRIAEKLDALGADISMETSLNTFAVRATVPKENLRRFAGFLGTVLAAPDFPHRAFERERQNLLNGCAVRRQNPDSAAKLAVRQMLFAGHPYANAARMPECLPRLTEDTVREFYKGLWLRNKAVFALGGDVKIDEAAEVMASLEETLPFHEGAGFVPPLPRFPEEPGERTLPLQRDQHIVTVGIPAPAYMALPDYPAFQILNDSMNGVSGRLFKQIREKYALAYATGTVLHAGFQPGCLLFYAATSPESGEKTEKLLKKVLKDLAQRGLSEAEFLEARQNGSFTLKKVTGLPEEYLFDAALNVFYGREPDSIREDMEILRQYRRETQSEVLRRHLENAALQCVHAGASA